MAGFERSQEVLARSARMHQEIAEIGQREARQRRTMAQAAERQLNQATDAVRDIAAEIEFFETNLKPDEEARLVIIGGPAGTAIFPEAMAALGIDRLRFEGVANDGCRVTVIQHVSQLNIMLKAVVVGEDNARRIGFHSTND
jgi:uncharacterized protein (DUF4213/DUF364 family)